MGNNSVKFLRMYDDVELPEVGTEMSVGIDLKAYGNYIIKPLQTIKIKTGLKVQFPEETFGKIENRSSMALKDLQVQGGIIDPDYTGEIIVLLKNFSNEEYIISKNEKIAQLICLKYEPPIIKEIDYIETTKRGNKGFGSTG